MEDELVARRGGGFLLVFDPGRPDDVLGRLLEDAHRTRLMRGGGIAHTRTSDARSIRGYRSAWSHGSQVCPTVEQVGGKGVPQGVGSTPDSARGGLVPREERPDAAGTEAASPQVQEQGRRRLACREGGSAPVEVGAQRLCCGLPQRELALLAPLAGDDERGGAEVEVGDVEPAQFGDPEPAGVEQLQDRPVPEAPGLVRRWLLAQTRRLSGLENLWQRAVEFGRDEVLGGTRGDQVVSDGPAQQRAQGAELAGDRAPGVAPGPEVGEVAAQEATIERPERGGPGPGSPGRELSEVEAIPRQGVLGEIALRSKRAQEVPGRALNRGLVRGRSLPRLALAGRRAGAVGGARSPRPPGS